MQRCDLDIPNFWGVAVLVPLKFGPSLLNTSVKLMFLVKVLSKPKKPKTVDDVIINK